MREERERRLPAPAGVFEERFLRKSAADIAQDLWLDGGRALGQQLGGGRG